MKRDATALVQKFFETRLKRSDVGTDANCGDVCPRSLQRSSHAFSPKVFLEAQYLHWEHLEGLTRERIQPKNACVHRYVFV